MFDIRKINGESAILLQDIELEEEAGCPTDAHVIFVRHIQDNAPAYIADWWDNSHFPTGGFELPEAGNVTEIGKIRLTLDSDGAAVIRQNIDQDKLRSRKQPNRAEKDDVEKWTDKALGDFIYEKMQDELRVSEDRLVRGFDALGVYTFDNGIYEVDFWIKSDGYIDKRILTALFPDEY